MRTLSWLVRIPVLLFAAGCASAAATGPAVRPGASPAEEIPLTTPAAIARARQDSIRHPYTAADIAFMSQMIGHHAQAIQIARWAPTHGANPEVRRLAARIIGAQQDEIAIMRRWLASREQVVPDTGVVDHHAHGGHAMGGATMNGMLTPEQLAQLDAARGGAFDQLFLRFMIQHHRGAVAMVDELFATDGAAQDETVFKFANDVQVDQRTEVARMERMLATLIFSGARPAR